MQRGEEYTTKTGKIVKKKTFRAQATCACKRNCPQNINSDRQEEIFNAYYKFENWTQKTLFLRTLTKTSAVKEKLNPIINLKKRNFSHKYYMSDSTGAQHQVCLGFLLNCVQITRSRLLTANKSIISNETAKDNRGNRLNEQTNENDISLAMNFISSFPTYESHYRVSRSNIKYLSPFLTITRIYREYCLKCNFKRKKPLSEWKFRNIFNTKFNLSFARLKVDTCRKCDMF